MSKEKRVLGNYEITQSIYIGDKEVMFGVDTKDPHPFMVCYCDYNNPLSAAWPTEGGLRTIIWKQCKFLLTECSRRLTAPKRNYPSSPLIRPCLQKSIVSPMTVCVTSWVKWWLSIPSRSDMNISTPPISLYWQTADTEQQAAEVRQCLELVLPQAKEPDGKGMMCLARLNPNVCPIGQRKPL